MERERVIPPSPSIITLADWHRHEEEAVEAAEAAEEEQLSLNEKKTSLTSPNIKIRKFVYGLQEDGKVS